jgi:hypothetical protein
MTSYGNPRSRTQIRHQQIAISTGTGRHSNTNTGYPCPYTRGEASEGRAAVIHMLCPVAVQRRFEIISRPCSLLCHAGAGLPQDTRETTIGR